MTFHAVLRMVPIDFQVTFQSVFIKPIAPLIRALIVIMANRTRPMTMCSRGDKTTDKTLSAPTTTADISFQSASMNFSSWFQAFLNSLTIGAIAFEIRLNALETALATALKADPAFLTIALTKSLNGLICL